MARYRQSGPIRFGEVVEYFGGTAGTPYNLSDYYKGGGIVPATGPSGGQAAVHSIAVDPNASSSGTTGPGGTPEEFYIYLTGDSGSSGADIPAVTNAGPITFEQSATEYIELGTVPAGFSDIQWDSATINFTIDSIAGDITLSHLIDNLTFNTTLENLPVNNFHVPPPTGVSQTLTIQLSETNADSLATYLGVDSSITSSQSLLAVGITFEADSFVFQYLGFRITFVGSGLVEIGLFANSNVTNNPPFDEFPTVNTSTSLRFDIAQSITLSVEVDDGTNTERFDYALRSQTPIQGLIDNAGIGNLFARFNSPFTVSVRLLDTSILPNPSGNNAITLSDISVQLTPTDHPSVTLTIPTDNINESLILGSSLTTDVALRDSLLTAAQANGPITDNWMVSAQTRSVTRNVYTDTGYISQGATLDPTTEEFVSIDIETDDDLPNEPGFAIGDTILYENDLLTITDVRISGSSPQRWRVPVDTLRIGFRSRSGDLSVYALTGTRDENLPVVEFISRDSIDHTVMITIAAPRGNLAESQLHLESDGVSTVPSEIRIDYGGTVSPQTTMIILAAADSQGIADMIVESVEAHGMLYASNLVNAARIEDSNQRIRATPTVNVTTAGTSALAASDFTVTEVQPGIPTTRTTDYLTIEYSTDDVSATTTGWNFQSSITGPTTTFTTWPSTGDIFLHVGLSDVVLDDLETTLGLTEINQTMQDVTDATLTFHYRFLDLVDVTTTYDLTGIRLVSSSSGTSLGLRLDGTTEVQSTTNTDPLFADEQVVGLAFFRRQMGAVNDTIPPEGLTGTSDYSTDQNLADGTFGFFDGGTSGSNNIELTEWPTTGIIYLRSQDEFNLATIRDVLGLSGFPSLTPLAVTHSTHLTISDGAGNEATYRVTMASIVSIGRLDELCLELDATTLSRESGTPAYTAGDTLTITFANPLDFTDFYNANDGSTL